MVEKNNTQRLLGFFFTFPLREIHLRELSREMKLSMPAIIAAVNKLKKERLVIVTKGKALTDVKANVEDENFIRLKRVDNLERMYTSGLVKFLSKAFDNPSAIICFGSYSRGEDTEISDIDIAIVGRKKNEADANTFEKLLKRKISLHNIVAEKVSNEFRSNLCNGIVLEGAL